MKEESAREEGEKEAVCIVCTCTCTCKLYKLYNVHVAYMYTKVTGSEHTGIQIRQRPCNASVFYNISCTDNQYATKASSAIPVAVQSSCSKWPRHS